MREKYFEDGLDVNKCASAERKMCKNLQLSVFHKWCCEAEVVSLLGL